MATPKSINELKQRMKKLGVSADDLDKFQEELDDADHDIESIKEDISDKEQSMLLDFFRENLDGGEKIYDYVKSIMDGKKYKSSRNILMNDNNNNKMTKKDEQDNKTDEKDKNNMENDAKKENIQITSDNIKWEYQVEQGNDGEGTVILNAGLMIIPDIVITNEEYLESINGISYVLSYNNAEIKPPRLPYQYVDFWNEYMEEEQPKYKQIAEDIEHNEGPTYDYLMEHPPNDRILPVLEKVVDQLKYAMLNSEKNKRSSKTYEKDIELFFQQQTPQYELQQNINLKNTCILFKKNTNDTNFNTFELFINILDIYDRILYNSTIYNHITQPQQITNSDKRKQNVHHFANQLDKKDCDALNKTIDSFKTEKQSFFKRLPINSKKINGNVRDYQLIALSFILFVKSFMCETGNCLEKGYHVYKAPKSKKKPKKPIIFTPNIQSLIDLKRRKKPKRKPKQGISEEKIEIDDGDIFFHNDNMPLQFDLCIIPKDGGDKTYSDYGLEEKYDDFNIQSHPFEIPSNRNSIYKLYGDFVKVFRETIKRNKLQENENNSNVKSNKGKKIEQKRDDRYCIVMDQKKKIFYMYPPHIKNGNVKIAHKKNMKSKENQNKKNDKDVKDEKKEKIDDKMDNKFSLISTEYNDITNFYLTAKCLIPSKSKSKKYYGIENVSFVLSAHFHQQRQWHRHPKLRFYQYFNGCGLRFLYKNNEITNYKCDKDLIEIWPQYFVDNRKGIDEEFVVDCDIFDAVMDIYKCDAQYFQWDNAVKRRLKNDINAMEKNKNEQKISEQKQIENNNEKKQTENEDKKDMKIDSICRALGRYYQSKNKPYDKLFRTYCDDNEIDEDALEDELAEISECNLVEFDENFPFDGSDTDKEKSIFKWIRKCYYNPKITFDVQIPKFDKAFFEITQQDLDETRQLYKSQCPKIYNCGMENDESFLIMLSIGRKNNFDYLQHLVDDYFRYKVKQFKQFKKEASCNVKKWSDKHSHFQELKKIKYKILQKQSPYQIAIHAVHSFGKRCCPQMMLQPMSVINDSLETTIRYIDAVCLFIANIFDEASMDRTGRAICPFQIDLCIAAGKPKRKTKFVGFNNEDDDDDDDDMDEKANKNKNQNKNSATDFVDCVGKIENKLKKNRLDYKFDNVETGGTRQRQIFTKLFNELEVEKSGKDIPTEGIFYNLQQKRMIGFVDRRLNNNNNNNQTKTKTDPVYFYSAPPNCVDIPRDNCGLWYISSSRTCLLPDLKYGNGQRALEKDIEQNVATETRHKLQESNITSAFHCKGGLLTISFHVKSMDEVKMYLYFQGQIIRFMPNDIQHFLPTLFNMDDVNNTNFIQNKEDMDGIMENVNKVIKDVYFNAFQQSYA